MNEKNTWDLLTMIDILHPSYHTAKRKPPLGFLLQEMDFDFYQKAKVWNSLAE